MIGSFHFLAAAAAHSPSGEQATRDSLITRDEVSTAKEAYLLSLSFTNQDLISCLHLLVNDTLSDKEFSLNSSTKADIYIAYLNVKVNGFQVKMWCNIFLTSVIIAKDFSAVRQIRRQVVETFY